MRIRAALFVIGILAELVCVSGSVHATGGPDAPDWKSEGKAAAEWLSRYIQLDTTNPPGLELKAAEFLKQELGAIGVKGKILPIQKDRVNIIARLKGNGKARPIILTHHMDVVSAEPKRWKVPPFSGRIVDGEVWGRGAIDMKGSAATHFWALKLLKERNIVLKRDVIFLGLADEEDGSLGAEWMSNQGKSEIAGAEYVINEGATIQVENGKTIHYGVATMEKAVFWLKLVAEGQNGHGSMPIADSAVNRLARAVTRIQARSWPIRLKPSVEGFFKAIADREKPELRAKLSRISQHLGDKKFIAALTANPQYNALLRNTVTVTSLQAGGKVNVIPGHAEALVDCRLLPGESKDDFLSALKKVIADDQVRIEETLYYPTQESPVDTELMRAIRTVAQRHDPGVPVVPQPLTSTTDSSMFRGLGMTAYGFEPFRLSEAQLATTHGDDERISIENVGFGVRFIYEVLLEIAADGR